MADPRPGSTGRASTTDTVVCPVCPDPVYDVPNCVRAAEDLRRVVTIRARLDEVDGADRLREAGDAAVTELHDRVHDTYPTPVPPEALARWARLSVEALHGTPDGGEPDPAVGDAGRPGRCVVCDRPVHPSATSTGNHQHVVLLLDLVADLQARGLRPDLQAAGRRHVLSLHPVAHDPAHPRVNFVAMAAWTVRARGAVRAAEAAAGRYDPYDPYDWPSGPWLLGLSWLLVAAAVPMAILGDGAPEGLVVAGTVVFVAWLAVFVARARPLRTTGRALMWGALLWPWYAAETAWRMTSRWLQGR